MCAHCCHCGDIVCLAEHTAISTGTPKNVNFLFLFLKCLPRGLGKTFHNILPYRNNLSQQVSETLPRLSINTSRYVLGSHLWPGSSFFHFPVSIPVCLCRNVCMCTVTSFLFFNGGDKLPGNQLLQNWEAERRRH